MAAFSFGFGGLGLSHLLDSERGCPKAGLQAGELGVMCQQRSPPWLWSACVPLDGTTGFVPRQALPLSYTQLLLHPKSGGRGSRLEEGVPQSSSAGGAVPTSASFIQSHSHESYMGQCLRTALTGSLGYGWGKNKGARISDARSLGVCWHFVP